MEGSQTSHGDTNRGGFSQFVRSEDFWKLVVGFALTTIVGGLLTTTYQCGATRLTERQRERNSEIQAATEVFNEVSRHLDRRLYRSRRLLWGLSRPTTQTSASSLSAADLQRRRDAYVEAVQEWNENINRTYALTERYFGRGMRVFLEQDLARGFICVSARLDSQEPEIIGLEHVIDSFNPEVYRFNLEMLRRIQEGRIGSAREEDGPVRDESRDPCQVR
jgi:hypothetical protein